MFNLIQGVIMILEVANNEVCKIEIYKTNGHLI